MLALKLLLVPALLGAISLAGRRWGPRVAGRLAGFPSLTGPILFFLAIEQGTAFTVPAAVFSISAVSTALAFGIAYAWACLRLGWFGSWMCATLVWMACTLILVRVPVSMPVSVTIALLGLFVAPRLFPKATGSWGASEVPPHELLLRMVAGAALVIVVTAVADTVGTAWTGVLAVFPVFSTVLAVFSQRANGSGFVVAMLRAMTGGFYSFLAFCTTVALLLERAGVAMTFIAAVAAAIAMQGAVQAMLTRHQSREIR